MMKNNMIAVLALLLTASCSTESRFDEPLIPDNPDKQTERREVMLTLNNKLDIQPAAAPRTATAAGDDSATTASAAADFKSAETNAMVNANGDPRAATSAADAAARALIATAEENAIATLDVYVFGAAEENGDYTFQQRFSYRSDEAADASPIPANAEELLLTGSPDADQNVTTGLLSLKRGLFVKIYCVANNTQLVNPATGNPMENNEFTPIKFNDAATAAAGNPIAAAGVPTEKDFIKLHTALLKANQPADTEGEVLLTPLTMSGAMTTPLDLTDNAATARLQTRLRLTRLAARFDIINEAAKSKFTIQSISMGNARRGTSYFPIAVKGDTPAKADEIITLTPRTFSSVTPAGGTAAPTDVPNANQGLSTGAFYAYPSPVDDKGYLILKGFYQVNKTEQKEVTYQVPFTQDSGNGAQTWLEINNNHRYTLAITDADDFHLDFTLNVADWEDDGNIDDYEPENKSGAITIEIPDYVTDITDTYDDVRKIHTVSMSANTWNSFEAILTTSSPLLVTRTYAGGIASQKYDWLEIEEPHIGMADIQKRYTFQLNHAYRDKQFPRAIVRFFDTLSGEESILYVEAQAPPTFLATPQPGSPNTFDADTQRADMLLFNKSSIDITAHCPDGVEIESIPYWLELTETKQLPDDNVLFTFTLNDRATKREYDDIVFRNAKDNALMDLVHVEVNGLTFAVNYDKVMESGNYVYESYDGTPDRIIVKIVGSNRFSIGTSSPKGIGVKIEYPDGTPAWLAHDAAPAGKSASGMELQEKDITFSLVTKDLGKAEQATVTLTDLAYGGTRQFHAIPEFQEPEKLEMVSATYPLNGMEKIIDDVMGRVGRISLFMSGIDDTTPTGTTIAVTCYGGSKVTVNDERIAKIQQAPSRSIEVSGTEDVAEYTLTSVATGSTYLTIQSLRENVYDTQEYEVVVVPNTKMSISNLSPSFNWGNEDQEICHVTTTEGCTVSLKDDNWGGGKPWFKLKTTDLPAGTHGLIINGLSTNEDREAVIKPVSLVVSEKRPGGETKELTMQPGWMDPDFPYATLTELSIEKGETEGGILEIAPQGCYGGWTVSSSDENVVSILALANRSFTLIAKGPGTADIRLSSNSTGKVNTKTFTVKEFTPLDSYAGGYKISPKEVEQATWWREDKGMKVCQTLGTGWHTPSETEWMEMIGTSSRGEQATEEVRAYYRNPATLNFDQERYWTSTAGHFDSYFYTLYINDTALYVDKEQHIFINDFAIRCIKKK